MVPSIFFLFLRLSWGLLWMGRSEVGFGFPSLPPLRMMTGPVQHFYSSILDAWRFSVFAKLSERRGFLGGEYAHLARPTWGNEIKCCWGPFCVAMFGTDSFLARTRRKTFPVVFVVRWMVMVTYFGSVLFSPSSMSGKCLSSLHLCHWIAATGPIVFFGMGACLDLVVLVTKTLGLPLLGI